MTLVQARRVLGLLGEALALFALPVLTVLAIGLVLILWLGSWLPGTQHLRLNYLGAALVLVIVIMAFGYLKGWKLGVDKLKGRVGMAEVEIEMADDAATPQGGPQ